MEESKSKRLFFALEVVAPWPQKLPVGRMLAENCRHMTLAFLGWTDFSKLQKALGGFPPPPFKVGLTGKFNKPLFLPKKHAKVAAWHVEWMDSEAPLQAYYKALTGWLQFQGFNPDIRDELLSHVTICRAPFDREVWEQAFTPLPLMVKNIHLYESIGNLVYEPIWTYPLIAPFDEIEHTADLAFNVHGETISQIQIHAYMALAFKFPKFLEFATPLHSPHIIEDAIANLNHTIALSDSVVGCPFKAVSYHGEVFEEPDGTLTWEMIVDV